MYVAMFQEKYNLSNENFLFQKKKKRKESQRKPGTLGHSGKDKRIGGRQRSGTKTLVSSYSPEAEPQVGTERCSRNIQTGGTPALCPVPNLTWQPQGSMGGEER